MKADELKALVAAAAGVDASDVTIKERDGAQIKANGLWEGSCRPSAERTRVGLFLASDSPDLAVEGAIARLTADLSQLPYPDAIVLAADPGGENQEAKVLAYEGSQVGKDLADGLGIELEEIARPDFSRTADEPPMLETEGLQETLAESPNVILFGPPGTGKSTLALQRISEMAHEAGQAAEDCRLSTLIERSGSFEALLADSAACTEPAVIWEFVQLHPNYAYDDLVRRIFPRNAGDGQLQLRVEDGLLPQLCALGARRSPERPVVLILDEINRGNLAEILGEFIFALDPGHRESEVRLQAQGPGVSPTVKVPSNLWIIGTMNSADRSLSLVDYAIRRRFRFLEVGSSADVIDSWYGKDVRKAELSRLLFDAANEGLDRRLMIAHSMFLEAPEPEATWPDRLSRRVCYQVLPLLAEYAKEGLRAEKSLAFRGLQLSADSRRRNALELASELRSLMVPTDGTV